MRIGIVGLPQVGKKTFFELLTGHVISEKDLASTKPIKGVVEIKDKRFDNLVSIYKPRKDVRAKIEIDVLPKLEKEAIAKGSAFSGLEECDLICHVVRAFRNESIYHVEGSVDPKRDIEFLNSELILNDLLFIEKRLERIEKNIKQTQEEILLKEKELLLKLKSHLDKGMPLRLLDMTPDERKAVANYPLLTRKALAIVLNVSEDDLKDTSLLDGLREKYRPVNIEIMQLSAKIEEEIALLESEKDRKEFLDAMGIDSSSIDNFDHLCLKALDLISFFTVKSDELRQWTLRRGSSAPEAAGAIHSDLQRGFIRAEVIKYSDLVNLGSEENVKSQGKLYIKGKDYIVEDGDIITIRFNV